MIIFLDFDGTTHPIPCKDRDFFSCLPRLENVLREYPHVQIVISSLWRASDDLEGLRRYFSEDIRPRVIDMTPFTDTPAYANESEFIIGKVRHEEILMWIERNDYGGPWVALDDATSEFPYPCLQLIPCAMEVGFAEEEEKKLRAYLEAHK